MRTYILIFFALFGSSGLYGQLSMADKQRVLRESYDRKELKDTAYINALNVLALAHKDAEPDAVLRMQEETLARSRAMGYQAGSAEALRLLGIAYENKRLYDDAIKYFDDALQLSKKMDLVEIECKVLNNLGGVYINKGHYPLALERFYEALKLAQSRSDKIMVGIILNNLANLSFFRGQLDEAEKYYQQTLTLAGEIGDSVGVAIAYSNLGELFLLKRDFEQSLANLDLALQMTRKIGLKSISLASTITKAKVFAAKDSLSKATELFEESIAMAKMYDDVFYQSDALIGLAALRFKMGRYAEARQYAEEGTALASGIGQNQLTRDGHALLADIYEATGDGLAAIRNFRIYKLYADSLNNIESERAAATMQADYEYSQKELQFQRKTLQQRWIIFSAFAAFLTVALIAIVVNRNRSKIKLANAQLNRKNIQIQQQHSDLEQALITIKATQDQLIQAEKMASLGELTSGVAHEIQNPLNFVNNFSEVSGELILEMIEEIDKGNLDEIKVISKDVQQNLEKILHHGKRADGIVKSMLYHSRTSNGKKVLTEMNDLCNEYLNLSYHGMKAKDKAFHATIESSFDPLAGKLEIIPQDIGRVLLNLFNNAFYAVAKKEEDNPEGFSPMVKAGTRLMGDKVEIWVEDNGIGIPAEIQSKIFQPFYTTKPTGFGTGLGLSISYDIVTKGHGGELVVESEPGKYSRFIVRLPLANKQ